MYRLGIKVKKFLTFVKLLTVFIKLNNNFNMGKGDKKSRRGKIILGTYGVRRPRKKADKASIKPQEVVTQQRPAKDKKERPRTEAKESRTKEKVEKVERVEKAVKPEKTDKEIKAAKEPKAKKEKKE